MNNYAGSIDTDMAIGTILSNFETAYIMNTIQNSLEMRFRPFDEPMPNYVDILNRQFEGVLISAPLYRDEILEVRTRTYQDGVYHATGKMTAIAMETDADGNKTTVPKITGLTKLGGGSMNNYSPKNKGGAKSPKSGGKGGKGGKGKGGGSSKEAKTIEKTEDKSDRYHKVDTQIEKTSNLLDKLEKAEEKALGGD